MRLHIGPSGFRPLFWVSYIQTLQMILHHPTQKEWRLHKAKQSMSEPYKHLSFKCCCVLEPVELQDVSISCSNAHL